MWCGWYFPKNVFTDKTSLPYIYLFIYILHIQCERGTLNGTSVSTLILL